LHRANRSFVSGKSLGETETEIDRETAAFPEMIDHYPLCVDPFFKFELETKARLSQDLMKGVEI